MAKVCTCDLASHRCREHPDGSAIDREMPYWEVRYQWAPEDWQRHGQRGAYRYYDEGSARSQIVRMKNRAQKSGRALTVTLTYVDPNVPTYE